MFFAHLSGLFDFSLYMRHLFLYFALCLSVRILLNEFTTRQNRVSSQH